MSRSFTYPEGWAERMHAFTMDYSQVQAISVIQQYRDPIHRGRYVLFTDADILRDRFEWTDTFINDVLTWDGHTNADHHDPV